MNKFMDMLRKLSWKTFEVDQKKIEKFSYDSVAKSTFWTPCSAWGKNFKNYTLHETDGLLEYRFSILWIFMSIISIIILWFYATVNILAMNGYEDFISNRNSDLFSQIFFLIACTVWLVYAVRAFYLWITRKKSFDKTIGCYCVGKIPAFIESDGKNVVPLSQIHALQIISEWVSGKNSYTSYELNLVLKDTSRINVIDHNNIKQIRLDAEKISMFLWVPIWDITL